MAAAAVWALKAVRCTSKVWARRKRAPPSLLPNCKFVIYLLNVLEEGRQFSAGEIQLCRECQDRLELALRERAAYWKQRGKCRAIREGDANTRFFHTQATHRLRRNNIRALTVDGIVVSSHHDKTTTLTGHLQELLLARAADTGAVDYSNLYATSARVDNRPLLQPFTETEAQKAVRAMNKSSLPGPDGFGPAFYAAAWTTVSPEILRLAQAFQEEAVDLERLNRAYVVMIPKGATASMPSDYRPICLQNCSLKITFKMLTTHLQGQIFRLIDLDQTGFIRGRSNQRILFTRWSLSKFVTGKNSPQLCSSSTLPRPSTL
ncbi:uncharacterized protein [Setaria viridis]|uniref:uncharacterized protein n=1 Tax=Setaria viridis TaxID=4556 RepID=UPI003B3B267E